MIQTTSIIIGSMEISWRSILFVMALPAFFFLANALYCGNGGKRYMIWAYLPFAILLCPLFGRSLYWYCFSEQYGSFVTALRDNSLDGFSMVGILLGLIVSALILWAVRLEKEPLRLFDALAPAAALGLGLLYLIPLFSSNCRGKFTTENPALMHLPFTSPVLNSQGNVEYRFATFFVSFLAFMVIARISLNYYYAHRKTQGSTACFFLLMFSAVGFILDSTRYDAGYFPFNGFVSVLQIFAGLAILGLTITFSILSIKLSGFRWYYGVLWGLILCSMGGTGALEYLVQRYADRFRLWYSLMSFSCLCMVIFPYILMRVYHHHKKLAEKALQEEEMLTEEEYSSEEEIENPAEDDEYIPEKSKKGGNSLEQLRNFRQKKRSEKKKEGNSSEVTETSESDAPEKAEPTASEKSTAPKRKKKKKEHKEEKIVVSEKNIEEKKKADNSAKAVSKNNTEASKDDQSFDTMEIPEISEFEEKLHADDDK